jgi:hypothetical protein
MTGALALRDSSAGIAIDTAPPPLLPNPPPVYWQMSTTCVGSIPTQRAMLPCVCATLCVEAWMNSLPFCQYAIALRVSIG